MPLVHFRIFLFALFWFATHGARIVGIYSVGSKSHFFSVKPAIEALTERGHQFTLFTPFKGISHGIVNVREIHLPETQRVIEQDVKIDWFAMQKEGKSHQVFTMLSSMAQFMKKGAEETLRNEEFRRIIAERDVDLFLIDSLFGNEFAFPVIDLIGVPFVTHRAASPIPMQIAALGGPSEYAYVPLTMNDFTSDMTFFQRLRNFVMGKFVEYLRDIAWVPMIDKLIKEEFPRAKSISEVHTDISLTIVNSHPTTTFSRSLPPTVIPIGALHTRPAKELPQDLKEFADNSKQGFILLTLGSLIKVSTMPKETMQCFMRVFSKLALNVVWKWEAAVHPEGVPSNVLMVDWLPQQDLLGHPNAKLFITHGGMMGTQEAIYHAVPMLALPFGNDQRGNMVKPKRDGYALQLDWDNINDDILFSAISYLVYEPKVKESAVKASELIKDELIAGKDLAVYWMEYVLRNNGTKHIQLASKGMPFYKQYLLDVIAFLLIFLAISTYCLYILLRGTLKKVVSSEFKTKVS